MSLSGNLITELTERVLLPLVVGGELRPLPPVGPRRALEQARLAAAVADFSGETANEIQWQRLRVARRICALDRLEPPSESEWLLVFALNDLLQATNPDLPGVFDRDRPARLIDFALELIDAAGPPRTLADALARHTTFSRALELVRVDTHLSWWVGSRIFRGAEPPARLLSWQGVRRVRQRREEVPLAAMVPDGEHWRDAWSQALGRWLAASPLTDLAELLRPMPALAWTGTTLGLLASSPGRTLARRLLLRAGARADVIAALERATQRLGDVPPEIASIPEELTRELRVERSGTPSRQAPRTRARQHLG
jgi:hypothetical protein